MDATVLNKPPRNHGDDDADGRPVSPHQSYGIRRAVAMILSFYDVGADKQEDREDLVRERVETLWGLELPFKRYCPQHVHEEQGLS